jgi:hypothetical protein
MPAVLAEHPLSLGQQALWFLQQMNPTGAGWTTGFALRFERAPALDALRDAISQLCLRHPVLRCALVERRRIPSLALMDGLLPDFQEVDAQEAGGETLDRLLHQALHEPYDFERGPLHRVRWFKNVERGAQVLLWGSHHLISDGWSDRILIEELHALLKGRTLPELPRSFADFVQAEKELLQGDSGKRLASFWDKCLEGAPSTLELRTDFERGGALETVAEELRISIPPTALAGARTLASGLGAPLSTVILAAAQGFLSRLTGQADTVLGVPVAVRPPGFERTVGYFVNLLPVRAKLGPDSPFREFAEQVHGELLDGLDHSAYPFGLIAARLKARPSPGRPKLVQVTFSTRLPPVAEQFPGLAQIPLRERAIFYDLELGYWGPGPDGEAELELRYNRALFSPQTLQRLGERFQEFLVSALSQPDAKVPSVAAP